MTKADSFFRDVNMVLCRILFNGLSFFCGTSGIPYNHPTDYAEVVTPPHTHLYQTIMHDGSSPPSQQCSLADDEWRQ